MNSPFNEAKYTALMEGLEATELLLSDVRKDNKKLRIDSNYFSKPMLKVEDKVRTYKNGFDILDDLFIRFVKGIFDINADSYTDSGIPFLRILNLKNGVINNSNIVFIPTSLHELENKTELKKGDIILSKTAYPAASINTFDLCNTSQDTIATTLSNYGKKTYTPEAIVAFLNSELGNKLLWRQFQGNVQLHLSLDDGKKVPIPRFNIELQNRISVCFKKSILNQKNSDSTIKKAEQTLFRILGLENWQSTPALSYERKSSEVFAKARLDSDFFSPKITQLLKILGKDKQSIQDVAPARHKRFIPNNTGTFNYIEIGGIQQDGTALAEPTEHQEAPSRATWQVQSGDIITSTVRPIRRLSAIITDEQNDFICSSGFVVLQPTGVAPEVLLTYLKLPVVCELMDLYTSASLYPAISETDLLNLPFPCIDQQIQQEIVSIVRSARLQKKQSVDLLEAAKHAVEIAIEDSEESAIQYLEHLLTENP